MAPRASATSHFESIGVARLACALLIASCVFGGLSASIAQAGEGEGRLNLIIGQDALDNLQQGMFEEAEAYLSFGRRVLRSSGPGASRLSFVPRVGVAGWYRVYSWWPQATPAASDLPVRIVHADGVAARVLDQTGLGGQWNPIGIYRFAGSTDERIELTGSPDAPLLADSVRLEFLGRTRPPLTIVSVAAPILIVGQAFTFRLEVESGSPPYRWRLVSGLPAGLLFDEKSGTVSGRPTKTGTFHLTVEIVDAEAARATNSVDLVIVGPPAGDRSSEAGFRGTGSEIQPAVVRETACFDGRA